MGLLLDIGLRIPQVRRLYESRTAALDQLKEIESVLAASEEERSRLWLLRLPYSHYNCLFDAVGLVRRHAVPDLRPTPGYLTNFLGVLMNPKVHPTVLEARAGEVEEVPVVANWHADISEWAAALRSIELARNSFTMAELGCGWGCWMSNSGAAARRLGLKIHLIGVEGDAGHIEFAQETLATNGFTADQFTLKRGVAAAKGGYALFPRQNQAGESWGLEPIFDASEEQRRAAAEAGSHDELPMISLADLTKDHPRIDLLHMDIQGGEADLVEEAAGILREKVAFLLVGTHSREIEGRLFSKLREDGWVLEIERPAILMLRPEGGPVVTMDGVQGWRNPALADT